MFKRFGILAVFPLALLLSGCAGANTNSGPRTDYNVLTQAEIQQVDVSNLYEVVQRLRPRWLMVRGQKSFGIGAQTNAVVVYQGQTLLGGTEMLRQIAPDMVTSVRYLDGATASASLPGLGSRHVEGAIVIDTGRPGR